MLGATAATAAGVTGSHASLITVNLTNNFISATGGNHLNADLTGDRRPDMTIANAFYRFRDYRTPSSPYHTFGTVAVDLNGVHAYAFHSGRYPLGSERLGSKFATWNGILGTHYLNGSIPIRFRDLHINGGTLTTGSLEVTVSGDGLIQLDSLTYNTRDAIPDQGSSLALLAIGAGGVLALRRWRAAQKCS
jgi:hypothetical protein